MKAITIGATLLFAISVSICSAQESVVGHYQSRHISVLDRTVYILKGVRCFVNDLALSVNADSTFSYKTGINCDAVKGKWTVNNRSLILTFNTAGAIDTQNQTPLAKRSYTMNFAIKDQQLSLIEPSDVGRMLFLLSKK